MKRTLNVSKYSSNKCMYGELARFPLSHNAWGLGIKYWLRLYNGTNNTLLNNCYRLNVEENHQWVQNIQYILTSNGFGDIWSNPQIVCGEFHKVLKIRLNDQFIQEWQGAISTSSRFVTRRALSIDYKLPVYINQISNPDIRLIYTRLRADLNILSTSRASKKQYETCPLCQSQPETVTHFILRCPFFQTERCHFFDYVNNFSPHLSMKSDLQKLAYILDLRCPPESIRVCCKYIYKVYTRRERCVVWKICTPSDIWLHLSVMSPWES